ncbi:MAG TPA: hypothetical protein PLL33_12600, partial [Paracoccus sp. (in: a-proteobacteria)]|nr:hypothetical protein [Paracoccus sp. (in: a-proteobacteria)]
MAREDFGFHVSAEGADYTWAVNSRDYQITPWSNDPVVNRPGEAILIHDPDTGAVATPFLALSSDDQAVHEVAHGLGYSRFSADYGWVAVEATMTLAADVPARLTRLKVTNRTERPLNLQGIAYAELVLGTDRARTAPMVQTHHDAGLDALVAQNAFSTDFADRITAMTCDRPLEATCGSRADFLGRSGSLSRPRALRDWPEETDAAGDPCLAIRWPMPLAPGATAEATVVLANTTADQLAPVLAAARAPEAARTALAVTGRGWD